MELFQQRSVNAEGVNPTHDFLSLCDHANVPPDSIPRPSPGGRIETHDFFQPLERSEKVELRMMNNSAVETAPTPAPPPSAAVEHRLPGGIGTYSISHIAYYNQQDLMRESASNFSNENSNCTSFTLWDESPRMTNKAKPGKENVAAKSDPEIMSIPTERHSLPLPSSRNHRNIFSAPAYKQTPDMIKLKRGGSQVEELEEEEEVTVKRACSSHGRRGDFASTRTERLSSEPKATPRSKHSATEQRRRSKINDRFQMLREIIPQSDQKRDKASFLLEVIEYIQFLQVKVQKYEGGYPDEPSKLGPRGTNQNIERSDAKTVSTIAKKPISFPFSRRPDDHHMGPVSGEQREHEVGIEGGTISISNVYSKGLLDALTRALQSSGVDLSQASLSVQIDVGEQPSTSHNRPGAPGRAESDHAFKKLKIGNK